MASVFCLDREGSLGCSWSKDRLQWTFCHLWMMAGGRQPIARVLVTLDVASLGGAKSWVATFPYAGLQPVSLCRELQCRWKWYFSLFFHSHLGKENVGRQPFCSLPMERHHGSRLHHCCGGPKLLCSQRENHRSSRKVLIIHFGEVFSSFLH